MLTNQRKAGVAILTSDRTDFKARKNIRENIIRDKKGHYIIIKGLILQEDNNL